MRYDTFIQKLLEVMFYPARRKKAPQIRKGKTNLSDCLCNSECLYGQSSLTHFSDAFLEVFICLIVFS